MTPRTRTSSVPFSVFVSYRRSDSAPYARDIYDAVSQHFGEGSAFFDIDSIEPGRDFVDVLNDTLKKVDVLLVVIGPTWLLVTDDHDQPRIADPQDHVRREIETALGRPDVTVIPVLVGGAQFPAADALPTSLAPLARRNAISLVDEYWQASMDSLLTALANVHERVGSAPGPTAVRTGATSPQVGKPHAPHRGKGRETRPIRRRRLVIGGISAALVVAAVVVGAVVASSGGGNGTDGSTSVLRAAAPGGETARTTAAPSLPTPQLQDGYPKRAKNGDLVFSGSLDPRQPLPDGRAVWAKLTDTTGKPTYHQGEVTSDLTWTVVVPARDSTGHFQWNIEVGQVVAGVSVSVPGPSGEPPTTGEMVEYIPEWSSKTHTTPRPATTSGRSASPAADPNRERLIG